MTDRIKISCIMPVYNSEKHLHKTLCSLMEQTFTEAEFICVNDASEDHSLQILEQLSRQDSRIVIIDSPHNSGAAASRNKGLEQAQGEYVIFLDADDYFYKDMLEQAYGLAGQYQADAVLFGYEQVLLDNEEPGRIIAENKYADQFQVLQKGERGKAYIGMIRHGAWNKLLRRDFLDHYGIRFQDIPSNNDLFFSMAAGLAADRTVVCGRVLMRYYMGRQGSITRFRRGRKNCRVLAFSHLFDFLEHVEIEEVLKKELYNYMVYLLECDFEDENNTLECKTRIERQIYENASFCHRIEQAYADGLLYPHAQVFAEKILRKEELKKTRFYGYYMPGIRKLLLRQEAAGKKLAVWGCGKIGKKIIDGMNADGLKCGYLIDRDVKKQNTSYGGYVIQAYDTVKDDVDTILAAVVHLPSYEKIKKAAEGKVVINLCTLDG